MRRFLNDILCLGLCVFLGGCVVPASVTATSWAIDGISYVTTNKSLTDHGLSFIARQDCAMYRLLSKMDVNAICQQHQNPYMIYMEISAASEIIEQRLIKNEIDDTFYSFDFNIIDYSNLDLK